MSAEQKRTRTIKHQKRTIKNYLKFNPHLAFGRLIADVTASSGTDGDNSSGRRGDTLRQCLERVCVWHRVAMFG